MRYMETADLRISCIGLGTRSLGAAEDDADRWSRVIDLALERGINLIDTAPLYQNGASEELLGCMLEGRREEVLLSTKVGTHGMEQSLNRQVIQETLHRSLERLRTDYIDILHVHYPDPRADYGGVARLIGELQEEGTIRSYGLSNFGRREYERWPLDVPPVTMQLSYNLMQYRAYDAMEDILRTDGVLPLVYTPLAGGLLTTPPDELAGHPMARMLFATMAEEDKKMLIERLDAFHHHCREHSTSPAAAATAYSLKGGSNAVLVATGSIQHAREILDALQIIDEEPVRALERIPQPVMPLQATVVGHVESTGDETLAEVEFESLAARVGMWLDGSVDVGTIVKVDGLTGRLIE